MQITGVTVFSAEITYFLKWVYVKQTYPAVKRKIFTVKRYEETESGGMRRITRSYEVVFTER